MTVPPGLKKTLLAAQRLARRRQTALTMAGLFALGVVVLWPTRHMFIGGDEGVFLARALRVLRGEVPYRDFFEYVTPGTLYIEALLLRAFGGGILPVRLSQVLLASGTVLLIYALGRRVITRFWLSLLPPLIFLLDRFPKWVYASHHWYSTFLSLCAVFMMMRSLEAPGGLLSVFGAGVFSGLTLLCMQNKGAYLLAALTVFPAARAALARRRGTAPDRKRVRGVVREVLILWLGAAASLAPAAAYFALTGALPAMAYDVYTWVLKSYRGFNAYPGYFWYTFGLISRIVDGRVPWSGWSVFMVLDLLIIGWSPLLAYPAAAADLVAEARTGRTLSLRPTRVLLFATVGAFLFATSLYRADFVHLVYVAPLTDVLLVYAVDRAMDLGGGRGLLRRAATGLRRGAWALAALLVLNLSAVGANYVQSVRSFRFRVETPRGAFATDDPRQAAALRDVLDYMGKMTTPGEKVFVYSSSAYLYFLLDIVNPTPFEQVIPGYTTDAQLREVVSDLEAARPRYVLMDNFIARLRADPSGEAYPGLDREKLLHDPVTAYITSRYGAVKDFGGLAAYRRGS